MTEDPRPPERRLEERSPCDIDAKIALDAEFTVACKVKDLSETGAKVEVSATIAVPAEFDLLLPVLPGTDQRFRVKLMWRKGNVLGGEFVDSIRPDASPR